MPLPASQRARPAAAIRSLSARRTTGTPFLAALRKGWVLPPGPHPFPSALYSGEYGVAETPGLSLRQPSPGGDYSNQSVLLLKKVTRSGRIEPVSLCASRPLPGMGGGSSARRGAWGEKGFLALSLVWFFFVLRLLPGMGGRSPARRGAWGERGKFPSTPPAPPYSPFCGDAKAVPLMGLYPARRVACGASARTFPGLWPG